ncbi:C13 family peptidase [Erythrobacter sp.]|uniref:C13 family peptidase n=1 Tax=Erythrobacter sp. TaxID=1042 RepID=UPI001425F9F3|nr:C13 family peptidase [Erythrobacter sp.]QIQ85911.1 MAG: peptidase C13 [Erythrobacter sp.]
MKRGAIMVGVWASLLALAAPPTLSANPNQPPPHTEPFPNLVTGESREDAKASFDLGPQMRRGVSVAEMLEQRARLDAALGQLRAHRRGTVDAYVVTVALDSDPVFAREAREAGRVLARRYGADGRTLVLAGPDGTRDDRPHGSIEALALSLARIAELMDPEEDALVLYTTSHGAPYGLVFHYGDTGYGILSPARLKSVLQELGIARRVLIVSACYSGIFIPELAGPDSAIMTAAAGNRTSFGCEADNDWTFYGDAMINRALRKPVPLTEAAQEANRTIAGWEANLRLFASLPQSSIGDGAKAWLAELEANLPAAADPVGRSAFEAAKEKLASQPAPQPARR